MLSHAALKRRRGGGAVEGAPMGRREAADVMFAAPAGAARMAVHAGAAVDFVRVGFVRVEAEGKV